ncbi:ABC transporter substrate-binding protein [Salinispira pacifica]|uniref:Amino acid ABC transporter, amino acid-binding/permease protein n=1 Tax=Salinispira pacifica TaxID=1307761 RepID=V5WK64_9SPIO|nr:ABC transporter substrate-binding protein [Salinispira pacifica]AHC15979.1 Amino acid ABC transporter, amino acid-binding/permease protein [Salinispira pacifica]
MKKIFAVLMLISISTAVFAAGSAEGVEAIQQRGKLILGTSADYAPYEFHTIIDGKDTIVGFDIEIAKVIAADLGVELEIQDIGFDGLLQALNSGKVDMVIAGMTPTEERKKSVDFSDVYYVAQQSVLVRTEDADTYTSIDALAGEPVGAQLSSIQEGLVKDEMPDSRLVALGKIPDLVLELKNEKVEALVVEQPVANGYVQANDDLAISPIQIGDVEGGSAVAVRKGSDELLERINETLQRLMADGSIDRFVAEANELNVTD